MPDVVIAGYGPASHVFTDADGRRFADETVFGRIAGTEAAARAAGVARTGPPPAAGQ